MAKKRDHKAEYARRKARATQSGYASVYQYRKARKTLAIPRNASPVPRRVLELERPDFFSSRGAAKLRREALAWSNKHSHSDRSTYRLSMSDKEVREYHRAYVEKVTGLSRRRSAREKRKRIRDYVTEFHGMEKGGEEWTQEYALTST